MVRLLPPLGGAGLHCFPHVSIPQWCDCCAGWYGFALLKFSEVSIPQWCDCCAQYLQHSFAVQVVSIPQWCDCCPICRPHQPFGMLVSIPQWCDCCGWGGSSLSHAIGSFNPTMVRLLRVRKQVRMWVRIRFNPTMVRLLLVWNGTQHLLYIKFQSHNGAIAALTCCILPIL